jgi:glycosyltransferase involved in cell wall biosynthesis
MKLSIITINRNNAVDFEKTIQSVVSQTFDDFEYIIIDGNSSDGSVDVIKKYAEKINHWISEPDSGIYNAMNKGIKKASGDYCLFLNSADCLLSPSTLTNVFNEIDCSSDIYYSNWTRNDNRYVIIPEKADINYLIGNSMNHQNMLIRRSLFIEHGSYNENFAMLADTEFILKETWIHKTKLVHINTDISLYDMHGISTTDPRKRGDIEREMVYKSVFGELGNAIIDLYYFRRSAYGDIVKNYGLSKIFIFALKVYRQILRIFKRPFKYSASYSGHFENMRKT